jgi:pimeloyl-ACP methyl ester carboxylesterase
LATLRSVVDGKGQTASALVHLPKAAGMPVLLLWGSLDPMIPVSHGENAAALLPHSRLVVFDTAGHDPHLTDPARFVDLVLNHVGACV